MTVPTTEFSDEVVGAAAALVVIALVIGAVFYAPKPILAAYYGDNNPYAGRLANDGHSMNGDKLCLSTPEVMCVSIAGSNGWSWRWEVQGDKLLQHGETPVVEAYVVGGMGSTRATGLLHRETHAYDIPPSATVIRVMGGPGIKWDTGYDYFRREGGSWCRIRG